MTQEDQIHDQVMAATAQALAAHGFAGFTMRDVAERIDASKATLHYRYDTKTGLIATWLEHNERRRHALFAQYADDPPRKRLCGLLETNLDLIESPAIDGLLPAYLELHTRAAHTEQFREVLREGDKRYRAALEECIEAGIEAQVFRSVDPSAAASLLVGVMDGAGLSRHTLGDEAAVSRLRTALDELVLESLLAAGVSLGSELRLSAEGGQR